MFRKKHSDDEYIPEEESAGQDAPAEGEEEQTYTFDEDYGGPEDGQEPAEPEAEAKPTLGGRLRGLGAKLSRRGGDESPAPEKTETPVQAAEAVGPEEEIVLEASEAEMTEAAEEPAPESIAPAPEGGKRRLSRAEKKQRKQQQKELMSLPEKVVREAPTVGRELKSSQMLVYDSELDEVDYTDPEDLPEARDYMPIRFRRYGRVGLGGGLLYALCVISVSVILASFGWMCAVDVLALNKEPASAVVEILPYEPTGDMPTTVERKNDKGEIEQVEIKVDIDQVADALKNGGIIEYKWLFKIFARISNANIKMDPGIYDLNTSYDYRALVTKMQFGSDSQETTQVTFPEGFSMEQIFTLLEQNYVCKKADLYEAAANYEFDYDFLEGIPLGDASRLEGFLFPDTYEFYQGEDAAVTLNRFLKNTDSKLSDEIITAFTDRGLTVQQGLTMASLIEKEAGGGEGERENMASAIYNRLAADMPLQIDATVNYALGTNTLDLTYADLEVDSPYNTYKYHGLPPGPICNPGMTAIEAVAKPASTGYYYWYSVDGVTYFFASNDEQQAFINSH